MNRITPYIGRFRSASCITSSKRNSNAEASAWTTKCVGLISPRMTKAQVLHASGEPSGRDVTARQEVCIYPGGRTGRYFPG